MYCYVTILYTRQQFWQHLSLAQKMKIEIDLKFLKSTTTKKSTKFEPNYDL